MSQQEMAACPFAFLLVHQQHDSEVRKTNCRRGSHYDMFGLPYIKCDCLEAKDGTCAATSLGI